MSNNTERVTYRPEGERPRTIYLDAVSATTIAGEPFVTGIEVDKEGNRTLGKVDQPIERVHVIELSLIVRRIPVVMDKFYGEFVELCTTCGDPKHYDNSVPGFPGHASH